MITKRIRTAMNELQTRMSYYQDAGPSEGWPEFLKWCGEMLDQIENEHEDVCEELNMIRENMRLDLDRHGDVLIARASNAFQDLGAR